MKDRYFILFIIFFVLSSIIGRVRKMKREDKAIAIALRDWNYLIILSGVIWFFIAFASFTRFSEDFKQAYWLLVPKYISQKKYLLFHYEDLISLANMFEKNKMYSEAITISSFAGYGLNQFYNGIGQVLIGIMLLVRSFDKDIICKDGIYTNNGDYKWKNIKFYKWGELESKQSRKENLEYYCLEFEVYSPLIKKVFKYEEIKQINMKISVNDKEKVEEFLKEKNK
ncbi:hypothetical protein [Clostridium ganghwense]|uniref:DUF5673 domain-containing protein n=1 Tax=Clostridium ganghwense TaxID=312089 RepID=A0ABT4CNQ5_9CLOT|nr:hypothetical protein [Clostridium ganghwense]MCY6370687.1 hypothetical protein [Clostridium ganghwense]